MLDSTSRGFQNRSEGIYFMNKFKEFVMRFKNPIFFSLLAVIGIFGVYVGYVTVDRYQVIVSGVLGLSTLYLLYLDYLSSQKNFNKHVGIRIEFPKDLRYLGYGFFLVIIMFWAMIQVVHAFWYLMGLFKN